MRDFTGARVRGYKPLILPSYLCEYIERDVICEILVLFFSLFIVSFFNSIFNFPLFHWSVIKRKLQWVVKHLPFFTCTFVSTTEAFQCQGGGGGGGGGWGYG